MPRTISDRDKSRTAGRFVGRLSEQRMFRSTLIQLAGLRHRRDDDLTDEETSHAQIFLVAAEGGMGKTTLVRRFEEIVNENADDAGAKAVYVDWEKHAPIANPDKLMRVLHDALCAAGFEHELQPYRAAVKKRTEVRQKAADAEETFKSLSNLGGKAVQLATGGWVDKDLVTEGILTGAKLAGALREFVAKKLDPDEWKLYDDPDALTEVFMDGVNAIATPKRPLVILLDTFEVADRCDTWLRKRAFPLSNPRLVWVLAGREGPQFIRQYEDAFEASVLNSMLLGTFARPDIIAYLKQCGLAEPSDDLIDQLQALSRGIPLALEGWINLYQKQVTLPLPDPALTTRREIVHRMTDRFLRYCNEDDRGLAPEERQQRAVTRQRILTLMLLRHTDPAALAAAWQCSVEQAEAGVNDLAKQFSFVFAHEIERDPHALVKEFVREYMRDQRTLPVALQGAIGRLVKYFEQRMHEREQAGSPNGNLRRPLWNDAMWRSDLLDLINALCWSDHSGERTMRLLVPQLVEALEFHKDSANLLVTVVKEFAELWSDDHRHLFEMLDHGLTRSTSWDDAPNELQAILDALQSASSHWHLTPLQEAILWMHRSRLLIKRDVDTTPENLTAALSAVDESANLLPTNGGELAPSLATLYRDIGRAYVWPRENEPVGSPEAARPLERATQLSPANAYAWRDLAVCYAMLKRHDLAITALQRAIALDPIDATAHNNLGNVYRAMQKYELAIAAYQQAIALNPTDASVHYNLGLMLRAVQKYELALTALQQAIALNPQYATAHRSLGHVYSLLGQHHDARAAYQQALELDPQNHLNMLAFARIERLDGHSEHATALIDQVRALLPSNDFYNCACAESVAGNVGAALDALQIALDRQEVSMRWAQHDPDFIFIRDEPRYRFLVGLDQGKERGG